MVDGNWQIASIDIRGLLGEYDLHWDLDPRVNILGGPNGSGKSTVLHALFLQFGNVVKEPEKLRAHSEAVFDTSHACFGHGGEFTVERAVTRTSSQEEAQDFMPDGMRRVKVHEQVSFRISRSLPEGEETPAPVLVRYINSAEQSAAQAVRSLESSAQGERMATTMLDLMIEHEMNLRNRLFTDCMSTAMQNGDEREVARLRELFSRFAAHLGNFMEGYGLKNASSLTFSRLSHPDEVIPYFRLSTGEKQVVYLLLSVSNTLGRPTILLLDEADMGMHVDWKRILLGELLAINPNMQIIAATHSPALIDGWIDRVREIGELCTPAARPEEGMSVTLRHDE